MGNSVQFFPDLQNLTLPCGGRIICMIYSIWHMFPGFGLYFTDTAQPITTASVTTVDSLDHYLFYSRCAYCASTAIARNVAINEDTLNIMKSNKPIGILIFHPSGPYISGQSGIGLLHSTRYLVEDHTNDRRARHKRPFILPFEYVPRLSKRDDAQGLGGGTRQACAHSLAYRLALHSPRAL